MDVALIISLFLIGLVLIIKGGDWFVDAAVWIAKKTGIPTFVIGATIVSFATTLPELVVSVNASLNGQPDVAIGNAIGSTICNIALISALTALLMPHDVDRAMFKKKGTIMIGSTVLFVVLAFDKVLTPLEGLLLFACLLYYVRANIVTYRNARTDMLEDEHGTPEEKSLIYILKFIIGAAFIVIGADLLVDNGTKIAYLLNVPEGIVALTLIALGTSLPELTTTVSSIMKGNKNIGLGNIIGANVMNITLILSTSSFVSKGGLIMPVRDITVFGQVFTDVSQTLVLDVPVSLVAMLIMVLPAVITGAYKRVQGVALMSLYICYLAVLVYIVL